MTLRSWIARSALWFLDFFLRERTPRCIALGVALGIGLGTFPVFTVQWFLFAVMALLLPVPLLIVFPIAAPLSFLTPLADSVFHTVGKTLLDVASLRGAWTYFYHLPLFPYVRFNNTVILGATLFGGCLAGIVAGLCFWLLRKYWRELGGHYRASPFLSSLERTSFGLRYLTPTIAKHWIRWQSLGLFFLGSLILVPLVIRTFPRWLHQRVEGELSALHGAPVHIDSIGINPWAPSLDIRGLSLMRSDGKHTLVLLDHLYLQLAWEPLLARKILIIDFTPSGFHLGTPSGSKPETEFDTGSFVEDRTSLPNLLAGALHRRLHEQHGVSPLRAIGELGNGMELSRRVLPLIPKLSLTLEIQKNSEPVEKEVVHWEERGESLQARYPIEQWEQDWQAAKGNAETKEAFFEKVQAALKDLKATEAEFRQTVEKQQSIVQGLRDKIPQAIVTLKNELRLPQLAGNDVSPTVFGPHAIHFIERLAHWVDRSRKFMPTGGARKAEQARSRGYSFHFGGPGQPPTFLLTRAELTSGETTDNSSGRVKGYVANVTSDPYILGRPMEAELSFEFPSQDWKGGTLSASFDHTGDVAKEKIKITLTDFSLANWEISPNQPINITAKTGTANLSLELTFEDDRVFVEGAMDVTDFTPDMYTLDREIRTELQSAMEKTRQFTLKGSLKGTLTEPEFELKSDWGVQLQEALRQAYHTPLAALDDAIQQVLLDEIDPSIKKQETQISQAARQVFQRINIIAHSLTDIRDKAVLPDRAVSSLRKKK